MAKKPREAAKTEPDVRGVDLAETERLLAFMEEHQLEEFEFEGGGYAIRFNPRPTPAGISPRPAAGEFLAPPPVHAGAPAHFPAGAAHAAEAGKAEDLHIIKSPIVGTFYAAPSPEAAPFVTVGAAVEPGQVLCIIEAMKLMNEIESDAAVEIAKVFVSNGSPVEYGESLFGIRVLLRGRK